MNNKIKIYWEDCKAVRRTGMEVPRWSWRTGIGLGELLDSNRREGYNTVAHIRPEFWHKTYYKAYCTVYTLLDNQRQHNYVRESNGFDWFAQTDARMYFQNTSVQPETPENKTRIQFYSYPTTPIDHISRVAEALTMAFDQGKEHFIMTHNVNV